MARTSKTVEIALPKFDICTLEVPIVGISPLIMHKWSDKAKNMIEAKQQKRATVAKAVRDPHAEYMDSMYILEDGVYGFPAVGFKAAVVRAGTYADMKMTFLRGAFHISNEFVVINGEPEMRTDMVRIGMGTADVRYRAQFFPWSAVLEFSYNAAVISPEQLVTLVRGAGFSVGVGEWRPERDGSFGMWEVGL